jgi:hypothetical protein
MDEDGDRRLLRAEEIVALARRGAIGDVQLPALAAIGRRSRRL